MDARAYKKQLYPDQTQKNLLWSCKGVNTIRPSKDDAERIYRLIAKLSGERNLKLMNQTDDKVTTLMNLILSDDIQRKNTAWSRKLNIDLVKGSIYKIKKYFLEDNNIKDIRGGSAIIDYVNNSLIIDVIKNNKNLKNYNLDEANIIYSGGGNILMAVPGNSGQAVCRELENAIAETALTVMNAFEFITVPLYDFAFDYKDVSRKLNDKLEERKKLKLYEINPDSQLKTIKLNNESININENLKVINDEKSKKVCSFCDIRDAKYITVENDEKLYLCPSCARKHIVGRYAKSKFVDEYNRREGNKYRDNINGSIDRLGSEMAVIYGDGNNLGNIVMNISNIFEMMYFSKTLDKITKASVYDSLSSAMKDKVQFEVIALGGDDIFIIVPAECAMDVTSGIIEKFNKNFENTITMSASIVYSKSDTPVASLFAIAQKRLKAAKHYLRQNGIDNDGTIDIVEVVNGMHLVVSEKRMFPMANKRLKDIRNIVSKYKSNNNAITNLYTINYARKNMFEKEFNLFYYYNASKSRNAEENIDGLCKSLFGEESEERRNPYKICWDDLLMIWKRG